MSSVFLSTNKTTPSTGIKDEDSFFQLDDQTKFINKIHNTANDSFSKLSNMIEEFTSINRESDKFLYNYFNDLERMIDLKRDLLISEIQNISGELKFEIIDKKNEIMAKTGKINKTTINIDTDLLNGHKTNDPKLGNVSKKCKNTTVGNMNKMDPSKMRPEEARYEDTYMNDSTLSSKTQQDSMLNKVF